MKYKEQWYSSDLCLSIENMVMLKEFQMIITSWAILSLAGGGLGKVEKEERQGEKGENRLTSHLQETSLG